MHAHCENVSAKKDTREAASALSCGGVCENGGKEDDLSGCTENPSPEGPSSDSPLENVPLCIVSDLILVLNG
jgi:hypothetical protein